LASALLAPLSALAGAELGAVLRQGAVAAIATVLLVLPLVVSDGRHWSALLAHAQLLAAWTRLVTVPCPPAGTHFPWTVAGAWTVFAARALLTSVVIVAAVRRRDQ
jgi:hypothetical protein